MFEDEVQKNLSKIVYGLRYVNKSSEAYMKMSVFLDILFPKRTKTFLWAAEFYSTSTRKNAFDSNVTANFLSTKFKIDLSQIFERYRWCTFTHCISLSTMYFNLMPWKLNVTANKVCDEIDAKKPQTFSFNEKNNCKNNVCWVMCYAVLNIYRVVVMLGPWKFYELCAFSHNLHFWLCIQCSFSEEQ